MNKPIPFIPYILFFCIINLTTLSAATHIVSNNPDFKAEFRSVQTALEHAHPYDTIIVMGSLINYGNIVLEKPVVLIGEGFSDNNQSGHSSKLTRVLLTSNAFRRTISSGSQIIGFEFPYFPGERPNIITASLPGGISIDNIVLKKNRLWFLHIVGDSENWIIKNNIVRGHIHGGYRAETGVLGAKNFRIQNNIVASLQNFRQHQSLVANNIIMGSLQNIHHVRFENNIFTSGDYILDSVVFCHFSNNLAYSQTIADDCYLQTNLFEAYNACISERNSGRDNMVGTDPGFVIWPIYDLQDGSVFILKEGSIAKTAGKYKNELGIFGGEYPFSTKAFRNQEIPDPFPVLVRSVK